MRACLDAFTWNDDATLAQRGEGTTSASKVNYTWDGIGRLINQSDTFSTTADTVSWNLSPTTSPTTRTTSSRGTNCTLQASVS